jgi:hypothetical protein
MATTLREVLNTFQNARAPLSLAQMAHDLDLPVGMLEGMIDHWVRKGKIREVRGPGACGSCSSAKHCGYMPNLPRSYELVRDDDPAADVPVCKCCG